MCDCKNFRHAFRGAVAVAAMTAHDPTVPRGTGGSPPSSSSPSWHRLFHDGRVSALVRSFGRHPPFMLRHADKTAPALLPTALVAAQSLGAEPVHRQYAAAGPKLIVGILAPAAPTPAARWPVTGPDRARPADDRGRHQARARRGASVHGCSWNAPVDREVGCCGRRCRLTWA